MVEGRFKGPDGIFWRAGGRLILAPGIDEGFDGREVVRLAGLEQSQNQWVRGLIVDRRRCSVYII